MMHLDRVKREDVVELLLKAGMDENALLERISAFDGMSGEEYAYAHGWRAVLKIFKRILY